MGPEPKCSAEKETVPEEPEGHSLTEQSNHAKKRNNGWVSESNTPGCKSQPCQGVSLLPVHNNSFLFKMEIM
jgi:hypothetical protein